MSSYALRLPDDVLEQARIAASEDKVSINQLLVAYIEEGLGHRRSLKAMQERAERADLTSALALLDRVPDVPPMTGDDIAGLHPAPGIPASKR